jgi:hypothetical protein
MDELVQYFQTLLQYAQANAQKLNPASQQALAQLLSQFMEIIQQQTQTQELPTGQPNVPQLQPGPYPSSNVNSFKYNPQNQELYVKFHGKDTAESGPTYKYSGVPRFIYDVFSRGAIGPKTSGQNRYHRWIKGVTPSLGGTLNALIKAGQYPYAKIA